jgi:hypothetical protein
MGPEGPVLRALEEATSGGLAPLRGSATFLVVIGADGAVVDRKLVRERGGSGWDETRESALRALAGKKLALRGANGAVAKIEVTSDLKLPSGASTPYTAPLTQSSIGRSANVASGGTPDVAESRTVGLFDLSDIGQKPRRVVHAAMTSLQLL